LLSSKCLDEIYCSLVAGGHGDDKADYVDPWRGRCANIGEGLKLLYSVPPMKIRLGIWKQVGDLDRKVPSGSIHEVLNGTGVQSNILERVAPKGTFTMLNASSYSKSSLRRGTPDFELSLITLAK
jgi:hypothetical protein